jgi:hypothetical protein
MKKFSGILAAACIFFQGMGFANSVSLFNDSTSTLKAVIYDANDTLLGEFILNPRDAADWSDDQMDFGVESQYASQTPYSVNWMCMNGGSYGSCENVAAGSIVTAQSCGGVQQCQQQSNGN